MTEFERAAYDITQRLAYEAKKEGQELKPVVLAGLFEEMKIALTSHARPAAGFIREATGPDRKVLGTLPVTADGCVVGDGAVMYTMAWTRARGDRERRRLEVQQRTNHCEHFARFYSTRDGAELSKGGGDGE